METVADLVSLRSPTQKGFDLAKLAYNLLRRVAYHP
jgi:hypothetical protein